MSHSFNAVESAALYRVVYYHTTSLIFVNGLLLHDNKYSTSFLREDLLVCAHFVSKCPGCPSISCCEFESRAAQTVML